ncbi:MAG: hypothetical protein KA604_02620 [Candidatus Saccharimonas sp.]|nr:hypothetical protein [Candidatus Saccharimonas sp.]
MTTIDELLDDWRANRSDTRNYVSPKHRRLKKNGETVKLYRAANAAVRTARTSGTDDDRDAAEQAITALSDHIDKVLGLNPSDDSSHTGTGRQPAPVAVDHSALSTDELMRHALIDHLNRNAPRQRRSLFGGRISTMPTGTSKH